jgi:hypothetical protein
MQKSRMQATQYLTAKLHRLAELIPWNRFLGYLKVAGIVVTSFMKFWVPNLPSASAPCCFIVKAKQIMKYSETTAVNYFCYLLYRRPSVKPRPHITLWGNLFSDFSTRLF